MKGMEDNHAYNPILDFTSRIGKPYTVEIFYYPVGKYIVRKPEDESYQHYGFISNKKSIEDVIQWVKEWHRIGMLL